MKQYILQYATLLGCKVYRHQYDAGEHIRVVAPNGDEWSASVDYGWESSFEPFLLHWLHRLPWPNEDDPRVTGEY
jgi:hypothetical protein